MPDLATDRIEYDRDSLAETSAPADPYGLFEVWLADAFAARDRGELVEPTAMVVATCADGRPRARTVLLKEASPAGLVFFTNYASAKGSELAANPETALHFGWYPLQRQVRVEGSTAPVARAESEAYFVTRPRGSQLGAWASAQSREVASRAELATAYAAAEARFARGPVPCPPHWGGYRVSPELFEFWQGQPSRMHDRLAYRREAGRWKVTRLAP